ncbi:MAG: ABC transporter ATP-binding protein [Hyphomicrobiales bacterium]|nr:ABC transporter ATP-binding protein [Hyphomicrobiales bacterium]MBV8825501.1 ABC transporter ATP-binding protein [Hyphomicrobiales bacterium]MBV9429427.1 ABC transporter ATP-binding protein [Bradyrhizobiaceae bacterium]
MHYLIPALEGGGATAVAWTGSGHAGDPDLRIDIDALHERVGGKFELTIPGFRLPPGRVTALIGPNGSGKSTLLSYLLGMRTATRGSIRVLGHQPGKLPIRERVRIGVQLQDAGYNDIYLVRDIRKLHQAAYPRSRDDVFQAFGVTELGASRFGSLSSGEKQRVQLAMAMAHGPDLMIFDEPTSNLDPHFEGVFCELLRKQAAENATLACLFVSHSPRAVAVCDDVLFLRAGGVEHYGRKEVVVDDMFGSVGCSFTGRAEARAAVERALASVPDIRARRTRDETLTVHGGEGLREAASAAARNIELDRFMVWSTDASDLLESIKND